MKSTLARLASPMMVISLSTVLLLVLLAIIAPLLWFEDATTAVPRQALMSPNPEHWLGTDSLGRDILLRTLVATRLSLSMALVATLVGAIAGLLLGALPVVLGVRAQRWFGAIINTWLAFPVLLVAMLIVIMLGASAQTAVIALAVTMTPSFARLAQTLSARVGGSEYLAAAKMLGISRSRQFSRYILPNIAEPIIVNVTISIGGGLLALSSLSFLGVGVQSPEFDWGRLLSEAFEQVYSTPVAALGPGLAVVVSGVAFGMLGEAFAGLLRNSTRRSAQHRRNLGAPPGVAEGAVTDAPDDALLAVDGLSVAFPGQAGWIHPVRDVSFSLAPGEIVGIVGESGSGKSVSMMAISGLAGAGTIVSARKLQFKGVDLLSEKIAGRKKLLTDIGIVFQDSLTALNPALRVGYQVVEGPRERREVSGAEAKRLAVESLRDVGIPDPTSRAGQFPHEYSGGMRQRALIAMAQANRPSLIIADEPTTALDVTVQRKVLKMLRQECAENNQAAIVVSHDIAVLAELCQRIIVMYAGKIVEDFDVTRLATPHLLAHPYTRALAESLPDLKTDRALPLATIAGESPDPADEIVGCAFAPRCGFATTVCWEQDPSLETQPEGGRVACWHPRGGTVATRIELEPAERS